MLMATCFSLVCQTLVRSQAREYAANQRGDPSRARVRAMKSERRSGREGAELREPTRLVGCRVGSLMARRLDPPADDAMTCEDACGVNHGD